MSGAWIMQQRRLSSPLPMVREWSECAGSYTENQADLVFESLWWRKYDKDYGLTDWEYRTQQVKKRKESK